MIWRIHDRLDKRSNIDSGYYEVIGNVLKGKAGVGCEFSFWTASLNRPLWSIASACNRRFEALHLVLISRENIKFMAMTAVSCYWLTSMLNLMTSLGISFINACIRGECSYWVNDRHAILGDLFVWCPVDWFALFVLFFRRKFAPNKGRNHS